MNVRLHANATTTPKIRAYIQGSPLSDRVLAAELSVSVSTVRRWRARDTQHDASHTPHRLATTLTPAQEAVVLELRRTLALSLDDLLVIVREFIHPAVSRSGLDRCLRRHGVSRLADLRPPGEAKPVKTFKDYAPGFVHIDIEYLPQMADETRRRYLFVAIDRASRWVYLELRSDKSQKTACRFLDAVHRKAPFRITKVLTDNDGAFTDRFTQPGKQPSGRHPFDLRCADHGIDHRLAPPRHPQTNGMVERFNGRISDVLASTRFRSRDDLEVTLRRYAILYNQRIAQKALDHRTPVDALREWQTRQPELFVRPVRKLPGPDT
ncbi:TPA: IS481 family transposase [Pseudomonas aeruginosa]|uniref:IS481 family transposase n=1 Tax=Stenotrophomonas acidaminiphila TaxID=128780 RepID=UPI0018C68D72|nr:IS481 family transposase [Pseudomonas aeruginosa]MBN0627241.1 IS481 family transposase [Pseudomonas aeruginosa]HBO0297470.1 IS481 family transposase [Pseudomonas aeruginosa]HBO2849357.1 IS481 family transposase [Pseudomonas aeruginosa]HBO5706275.1 IS481 family transposase [Pseudomonas aeruginosa]